MLDFILGPLVNLITSTISSIGLPAVFVAMMLQSACVPIPSEVILPFSGFFVSQGIFEFWPTIFVATLGAQTGSVLMFLLGYYKGEEFVRNLIKKYGKYILVFEYELDEGQHWFQKYGQLLTFVSRLMPIVRTFIALPAGISQMKLSKFMVFVFLGDFFWSLILVSVGKAFGQNWTKFGDYFHKFDIVIVLLGVAGLVWYVKHKLKKHKKRKKK